MRYAVACLKPSPKPASASGDLPRWYWGWCLPGYAPVWPSAPFCWIVTQTTTPRFGLTLQRGSEDASSAEMRLDLKFADAYEDLQASNVFTAAYCSWKLAVYT